MSARNRPVATSAPRSRNDSDEVLDQRFRELGACGLDPRGTTTLAGVAVERELADDQQPRGSCRRPRRPCCRPRRRRSAGSRPSRRRRDEIDLGVAVGHPDEHAQTGADLADHLAVDPDPGLGHSLHQRSHGGHPRPGVPLALSCRTEALASLLQDRTRAGSRTARSDLEHAGTHPAAVELGVAVPAASAQDRFMNRCRSHSTV